jgi:hypothetical protein
LTVRAAILLAASVYIQGFAVVSGVMRQSPPAPPTDVRLITTNDGTAPAISLTAPAAGSVVAGSLVTVSAHASDDVGVAGVRFVLDGFNLAAEDTTPPYSIAWNTMATTNGTHALVAIARDAAGNTASAALPVMVGNAIVKAWPYEPNGLAVLTDWGLDQDLLTAVDALIPDSPGWRVVNNSPAGSSTGWALRVPDLSAPVSPVNVLDFVYPEGMVEGRAPATVYYNLSVDELYAGFWWRTSPQFDRGPNGNKIAFMFNGGGDRGGQQFLILHPDGRLHVLPEYPGDFNWRRPNVNDTVVEFGVWHRVEWYSNRVTGALAWWLDGVLQGSYTDVRNSYKFDMFQFSPTWGGNSGARKKQTDHYWFDHAHLSGR